MIQKQKWRRLVALTCCLTPLMPIGCGSATEVAPSQIKRASSDAESDGLSASLNDVAVEVACGECQFQMPGSGCDLAVRIDGKSYFVDGSGIDDHGDAHADNGLCNCVRRGTASGRIEGDRFVATKIVLDLAASADDSSAR